MEYRALYAYNLAVGASSVTGARVVPFGVKAIRLSSTTACYVTITPSGSTAAAPSAGGSQPANFLLAANWPETFACGVGDQVSVIQAAAAGTLNVTELAPA